MKQHLSPQFQELASHLDEQLETILVNWRMTVEQDERLALASRLARKEFEDNVPTLVQLLSQQLRREAVMASRVGETDEIGTTPSGEGIAWGEEQESQTGQEHGFHRWQEGYDLRQLMLEWGHLNQTMVRLLNEYGAAHPEMEQEVTAQSRLLCAQLLDSGYVNSVAEYHRLQQAEAKEIVNSLSDALSEVTQWGKYRGQVLREAVHDLRGNLSVVQGATSLLDAVAEGKLGPEAPPQIFKMLQNSTQTLYLMLTELLDLARLEAGQEKRHIQTFDAAILLRDICESSNPLAQSKQLFIKCDGPSSLMVEGDAMRVRRVVQNLLLNALKYTHEGGVTVRWSEGARDQWCLTVEDTGPGFSSAAELPLAVASPTAQQASDVLPENPEESASPVHLGPGEGVGLAIVKRLCTLLDAQLEMQSEKGVGTKFRVALLRSYPA